MKRHASNGSRASLPICSYSCCARSLLALSRFQPTRVAPRLTQCHGWGGPTRWSVSLSAASSWTCGQFASNVQLPGSASHRILARKDGSVWGVDRLASGHRLRFLEDAFAPLGSEARARLPAVAEIWLWVRKRWLGGEQFILFQVRRTLSKSALR